MSSSTSAAQQGSDRRPSPQAWLVLVTTVLGWTVTSLDLQLSAFLQQQIGPDLQVGGSFVAHVFFVFALGLALGALTLGYFSDLWIGRRRAFMYSIVGTIVMTGLTGFTQTGWQFVIVRFLAGVFSGGEWILGLSILSEVAPRRHRSLMLAATQAAVGLGYGIANVFAATFAAPEHGGWRWAYWGSFVFAAMTYVVRTRVEESPQWSQAVEHGDDRRKLSDVREHARSLFSGRQRKLTLLAVGLFIAMGQPQGTWDFQYPKWYHAQGGHYSGFAITYAYELAIIVSTLAGGWFMDRVSVRWLMPAVWISLPFTALIWLTSPDATGGFAAQAVILFLAGFGRQSAWALVAGYFPVLFRTRERGTGMGITWVGGWLFGYTLSAGWGPLVQSGSSWNTWWLLQLALLAVMPIPMLIAGVETKGRELDFQDDPDGADTSAAPTD